MRKQGPRPEDKPIEIIFRKAVPIDSPGVRYPGFNPSVTTLKKGTLMQKGALPLPCDIIFERDVAVTLRDATVIYANVFRPTGNSELPAIIVWSPYGKDKGKVTLDDFPGRAGVPKKAVSGLQKWEGPDPAYWCEKGYAVIHPDVRGSFSSNGDIRFWGKQDAEDGYDVVEWAAEQPWSNGKVGFSGNSWLAISQWFIAAEKPPHLSAIAPWEGLTDMYRGDVFKGGIQDVGFNEMSTSRMVGRNRVEDVPAMVRKYPLMNAYWEEKSANLEKIEVPAYVVASWSNNIHSHGTFEGYRRISSSDKWLRVHNTMEWYDYYLPENVDDLRRFFDRYLKEDENGWEDTPRVRISVLDPGGVDTVKRAEKEFPLARTEFQRYYLDGHENRLSPIPGKEESVTQYSADDGKSNASFTITCGHDTELTGYLKLRLWVEADGSDDMDLFASIEKLGKNGKRLTSQVMKPSNPIARFAVRVLNALDSPKASGIFFKGPSGRLRVSHRQLDPERSTESQPFHSHQEEARLSPGEIVLVDIPIGPVSMRWRAGEQLRLIVSGSAPSFPVPGIDLPKPVTRNKGTHLIHSGGKYDSYLLVPVIPGQR